MPIVVSLCPWYNNSRAVIIRLMARRCAANAAPAPMADYGKQFLYRGIERSVSARFCLEMVAKLYHVCTAPLSGGEKEGENEHDV